MASLCCDERQSSASDAWQPAQVPLPTKLAAELECVGTPLANGPRQPLRRSSNATPAATMIAAAADAAIQILVLDRGPAPSPWIGVSCVGMAWAAPADFFPD